MTSSASTGGSGALFEAQVGAAYLLSMLLEVDARGLPNCRIESIRLQRGQEGYPLDAERNSVKLRVDYQGAALWLKQARPIFEPEARPWLRAVVSAYGEWTRQANGFGQEKEEQYDGQPDSWNEVYFELAAKCAAGLSTGVLEPGASGSFCQLAG
jgi:hypothetical protein